MTTAIDDALPKPGDVLEGKVEILRMLGKGGMGAVFEARHRGTGRRVAVKVMRAEIGMDPIECSRFLQEALACGRVHHPNVVDILDASTANGRPYLVMELLEGESLGSRIASAGALSVTEVLDLMAQALAGVAAAHAAGIVHRDLKPDNIFLSRAPTGAMVVKVLDFGISKLADVDSFAATALSLTQAGAVLGTPYYMSPEQVRGVKDIDGRSDVYAAGAVLYHALTGRPPFLADSYNALIAQILLDEPPPLATLRPDLAPSFVAVVERALAKRREDRFATMTELVDRLTRQTRLLPGVTVMLTDLAGFLDFATGAPLEDVEEVLEEWERAHREILGRHGGVLRAVVGDEMLLTLPSVEAAVNAWLELASPESYPAKVRPQIKFRAGLASGDVRVVRSAMFGATLNIAARLTGRGNVGELAMPREAYETLPQAMRERLKGAPLVHEPPAPAMLRNVTADAVTITRG
jgi:class 3 adenylate cyclase